MVRSIINPRAVGFESIFNELENLVHFDNKYPPYNIEKTDGDDAIITIAVAGFDKNELSVILEDNKIKVSGRKEKDSKERVYLVNNLALRNFNCDFLIGKDYKILEDQTTLNNGLLSIKLIKDIPEEKKPRLLEIK